MRAPIVKGKAEVEMVACVQSVVKEQGDDVIKSNKLLPVTNRKMIIARSDY